MKKPNDTEMGRIALKLLIHKMSNDDLLTKEEIARELPNIAKQINEPVELLKGFTAEILPEIIRRKVGCHGVELTFDGGEEGPVTVKSAGLVW